MLLKDKVQPVAVLESAIVISQQFLSQFAESDVFVEKVTSIFGNSFNSEKLNYFRQSWLNGDFESLPEIEIRFQEELGGANGAFAVSTNKIYLSEEYISQNSFNSGAIVDVLLEEIGHFVDANINQIDTVGDEGAIFSAVVQGVDLGEARIQDLKSEDDINIINLNNQKIQVEQDTGNPTDLTSTTDDTNSNPNDTTSTLVDGFIEGIEKHLSDIEKNIKNKIGEKLPDGIPLIGDIFKEEDDSLNFIEQIKNTIVKELEKLQKSGTNAGAEKIKEAYPV